MPFLLDFSFAIALSTRCVCLEKVCSVRPVLFIFLLIVFFFVLLCFSSYSFIYLFIYLFIYFLLDALCFVIGAFLE